MSESTANPTRLEPYKNMKFRINWDDRIIPGVSKMSPLRRTTDVLEYREGNDPSTSRKLPGLTKFDPIIFERGLTDDTAFEDWVNKVWRFHSPGNEISPDFRKNIIIEFLNEAGQVVKVYHVFNCWPSEYQALPDLDANNSSVAIEMIKLENEGWERVS
jgi:phage tail-like protein